MRQSFQEANTKQYSDDSDADSLDQQQFQVLNSGQNNSVNSSFSLSSDINKNKKKQQTNMSTIETTTAQKPHKLIEQLNTKVKQQEKLIIKLQVQKQHLAIQVQNSQKQMQNLKEKLNNNMAQNNQLRKSNMDLKELVKNMKQESEQYIDKINCLHKKNQLQKQQIQNKFNSIKRGLQSLTKLQLKNVNSQGLLKVLNNRLGQMSKIVGKIVQINDMIIQKNQQTKTSSNSQQTDILIQKVTQLDKIANLLVKQQAKITNLKQQNNSLNQQIQKLNKKNGGIVSMGIGKFFDPVIKFCKIQETRQTQVQKRQEGLNKTLPSQRTLKSQQHQK